MITPSGAPPIPITAWMPVPWTAQLIAADTSPSLISLIRAPVPRTSAIRSSWRGRSRMTTVMSVTLRRSASAIRWQFSAAGFVMSTQPAAIGPTASFSR